MGNKYSIRFSWVRIFGRSVGCESEFMPIIRNLTHVFCIVFRPVRFAGAVVLQDFEKGPFF